jgi:hypothetical protein
LEIISALFSESKNPSPPPVCPPPSAVPSVLIARERKRKGKEKRIHEKRSKMLMTEWGEKEGEIVRVGGEGGKETRKILKSE